MLAGVFTNLPAGMCISAVYAQVKHIPQNFQISFPHTAVQRKVNTSCSQHIREKGKYEIPLHLIWRILSNYKKLFPP